MSLIPAATWLRSYDSETLRDDMRAGLVVAVMLVPQSMAYAALAGLPPVAGLYASIVPLVVYAFLGTSGQMAVGPVAVVSLLTASGLAPLADGSTTEYIALAGTLALMVGMLQLALGALRLGSLTNLLSHPVLTGFLAAAALTGIISVAALASVDSRAEPTESQTGIAEAIGMPTQIAQWVRSDEAPDPAELWLTLEDGQ